MLKAVSVDTPSRIIAAIAYIPVIGWLLAILTQRRNEFVMFHVKQAIGLVVFLIVILAGWVVVTWLLAWIPLAFLIGNALFALVIAAYVMGAVALIIGIISAARGRVTLLPVFGGRANRLPL